MAREEPLRSRQRLSLLDVDASGRQEDSTSKSAQEHEPPVIVENADTSFNFMRPPLSTHPNHAMHQDILDINKYISVGCLRLRRTDCAISSDVWKSCHSWCAFAHPRDIYNSNGRPYLLNALQEILLRTSILQPYRGIHNARWIRMEFKMMDQHLGQIRVYILPDDVGRSSIDREQSSLRRSMQLLLTQLDISKSTWSGSWSEDRPVVHIDSSLDAKVDANASLFYLFNTLPSPKPDPEVVSDRYAREAMYRILDSDIKGLTTTMHAYQRRSAAMMLQREAQPSQIIDPRLRSAVDQNDKTWYFDLDAGSCLRDARTYEAAKGGICAETMGLGKTLICLALILATRELSSAIPVEFSVGTIPIRKTTGSLKDMSAATIGRTGTPWKNIFAQMEAEGYDFAQCLEAIKNGAGYYFLPSPVPRRESRNPIAIPPRKIFLSTATLVVVPSNLVQQWRHEIKKHTVGLDVLVMNSMKTKLPPAKELAKFDLILFSKQRFDKESKDGSDEMGRRRTSTSSVCHCPYLGNTREKHCICFKDENAYRSPLKDLHFKRLITDEGHTLGNSSSSSKTEAVTVVEFLQLSARWVVSGTPTQGLYGAEAAVTDSEPSTPCTPSQHDAQVPERTISGASELNGGVPDIPDREASEVSAEQERIFYRQERKDLEKLGNIATLYLKARPWAITQDGCDSASWSQHVMQPRHGSKSHGNMTCLRSTLEGMIIRHRPEDVMLDVTLPPLHQNIVYLDGSFQDKLSLNMFSLMIVSNAITSERKDADYLFHPRQRKSLQQLVSNLRQASFFWSGYSPGDVQVTIDIAKRFVEKSDLPVSPEDEALLTEAIIAGEYMLSNSISRAVSKWHEMPMYVYNEWPESIRAKWSLDGETNNPTLMGTTMVHACQMFVESQLWKDDPMEGLGEAGEESMKATFLSQMPKTVYRPSNRNGKEVKIAKKPSETAPVLAGGVTLGDASSPKKRTRLSTFEPPSTTSEQPIPSEPIPFAIFAKRDESDVQSESQRKSLTSKDIWKRDKILPKQAAKHKSSFRKSKMVDVACKLDPISPLNSTAIISTSSAKLSYLLDRIIVHHATEKILVFYEADNVAYYIAQALECLQIKHLIYAKTLSSARRSQYVVTFNQSETFRVLLMEVSQAAFGLDMSSASRVFFINPVFSPQVEAQAVKRAHRIGQTKPVFVETLVLNGSIEEVILERRKKMSNEELNKCKTILDDQTMYDWIRNVRFLPLPTHEVLGPDQLAKLETPQPIFGRGAGLTAGTAHNPDADLVLDEITPKDKGKRKAKVEFFNDNPPSREITPTLNQKTKGTRKWTFEAGAQASDYDHPDANGPIVQGIKRKQGEFEHAGFASPLKSLMDDEIQYEHSRKKKCRAVGFNLPGDASSPSSSSSKPTTPTPLCDYQPVSSKLQNGEGSLGNSAIRELRARLDETGAKSLLVKMQLGQSASKVKEMILQSAQYRTQLIKSGCEFGIIGSDRAEVKGGVTVDGSDNTFGDIEESADGEFSVLEGFSAFNK